MLKNKNFLAGAVIGLAVAGAAAAGAGLRLPEAQAQPQGQPAATGALHRTAQVIPPPGAPMTFADIIERVSPAVVSIDVRSKVDARSLRNIPGLENFPFDIVPRGRGQEGEGQGEAPELPDTFGSGSGFFISSDGYIVTNNHVVQNAEEITVRLQDEREFKARIVGRDEATDLAVLKVEGRNFPFVEFEREAKPRVGDWVIALGNPLQLGHSATAGIVSARGRDIGEQYVDFIQIDAPINRGNSGGPTFDIYGRVIGVNTAIFSPTGYSVGIGFAIPADVADTITRQLISDGKVERGYIGVTIQSLSREAAEAVGLPNNQGAVVNSVVAGGPSDRAGLRAGDIILRMNDQPIRNNTDLTRRVAMVRAGETVRLEVFRDGRTRRVEIRSGVRPSEADLRRSGSGGQEEGPARPQGQPEAQGTEVLGMSVLPLDAAARRRFEIPQGVEGLVITRLVPQSEAARRQLRPGDVIVQANTRPVETVQALQSIIAEARKAGRPSVLLLVRRGGDNFAITLPLGN